MISWLSVTCKCELYDVSSVAMLGGVEEQILTPLSLSPNPFRLARANSMVMRWWQMLACLYNPPDPPTHANTPLLPDGDREVLN